MCSAIAVGDFIQLYKTCAKTYELYKNCAETNQKIFALLQFEPLASNLRVYNQCHHNLEAVPEPQTPQFHQRAKSSLSPRVTVVVEAGQSSAPYVPLWKRFSRPTVEGTHRHADCYQNQTEDFLAWLLWQQHGLVGTPQHHLEFAPQGSGISWTEAAFIECRNSLLAAIVHLPPPLDRLMIRMAYILAMVFCQINVSELSAALSLASASDARSFTNPAETVTDAQTLEILRSCSEIFVVDGDQNVHLKNRAMCDFLTRSGLPDFENGQLLMGQIYLQLVHEGGLPDVLTPFVKFREWYCRSDTVPFSKYLARYGAEHCRRAQKDRPIICGEIHQQLMNSYSSNYTIPKDDDVLTVEAQRSGIDCCYEASLIYGYTELMGAYEGMGATFDARRPKLLPKALSSKKLNSRYRIVAFSDAQEREGPPCQTLQFRPCRRRCNRYGDVDVLNQLFSAIDLSESEFPDQASSPVPRSLACKLENVFQCWTEKLSREYDEKQEWQRSSPSSWTNTSRHSDRVHSSESFAVDNMQRSNENTGMIGNEGDWQIIDGRDIPEATK